MGKREEDKLKRERIGKRRMRERKEGYDASNSPEAVGERGVGAKSISRARALHLFLALIKPLGLDFNRDLLFFRYVEKN